MKNILKILISLLIVFLTKTFFAVESSNQPCPKQELVTCKQVISQTWDQRDGKGSITREREVYIRVPSSDDSTDSKFPLLFVFHGNGGNGKDMLSYINNKFPDLISKFIIVAPSGYEKSWNVVAEKSRAPDLKFFEKIVDFLTSYSNVKSNEINLYGISNGSGLVNNILIGSSEKNILRAITEVSQLNIKQYHRLKFWLQGNENKYKESVVPIKGRKILIITGELDLVVPPDGGESRISSNYSETENLKFLSAENSAFAWAKAMGYSGVKAKEYSYNDYITYRSYLNNSVLHFNFATDGHNIKSSKKPTIISDFLIDKSFSFPHIITPTLMGY